MKSKIFLLLLLILFVAGVDLFLGYNYLDHELDSYEGSKLVHHLLRKNSQTNVQTSEYTYSQNINSIGTRGQEPGIIEGKKKLRILMLGDDFTLGKGVADNETFSAILQKLFHANGITYVDVLNAGVDSYSPLLSYLQLYKGIGREIRPDIVVLNVNMSDLLEDDYYRKFLIRNQKDKYLGLKKSFIKESNLSVFIANHFYFLGKLFVQEKGRLIPKISDLLIPTIRSDKKLRRQQWNNLFESISRIAVYCIKYEIPFYYSITPWGHQVSKNEWKEGRKDFLPNKFQTYEKSLQLLREFSRNYKTSLLDLFGAFRNYKGQNKLFFNKDQHWTKEGHTLVAAEHFKFLVNDLKLIELNK